MSPKLLGSSERLPKGDNFSELIEGIGPAIESRLHEAGILSVSQLAAASSVDLAELIKGMAGMSAERITKLDWQGQACRLAPAEMPADSQESMEAPGSRQYYATFTVKLLLENKEVRRTHVTHLQGKEDREKTWSGWREAELIDFFVRQAGFRLPVTDRTTQPPTETEPTALTKSSVESDLSTTEMSESVPQPKIARESVAVQSMARTEFADPSTLRLQALEVVPSGFTDSHNILRYDQPFEMHLTLEFPEEVVATSHEITYAVIVYASSLGEAESQILGEAEETIKLHERSTIVKIKGRTIPRGMYSLGASVTVSSQAAGQPLATFLESGGVLHIH